MNSPLAELIKILAVQAVEDFFDETELKKNGRPGENQERPKKGTQRNVNRTPVEK